MTYTGTELTPRLVEVYGQMDSAYADASREAGFSCAGCNGVKCCTVDLIVHTFAEMLFLRRGFRTLKISVQKHIKERCREILKAKATDPLGMEYRESVCALNLDGLCVLFEYRPMICRLAGIPHIIRRPDSSLKQAGGCTRFEDQIKPVFPDIVIDRTSFYQQMAQLEIYAVQEIGNRTVSRTISEILSDCI
ncbi:MAG: hypothetical protein PHS86_00510 [Syntrophaceae bacterium]|nr:hypothetical protein [Syntrophaceae bacterium]